MRAGHGICSIILIANISKYQDIFDILPFIAAIFTTLAIRSSNFNYVRVYYFITAIAWILYDLSIPEFENMVAQVILIVSIFVGFLINEVIKKTRR